MADPARAAEIPPTPPGDSQFARASSLPRRLGLWSAIAVLVGSTIGSGIFRSPAGIADKLPGPLPLLAIWLTGGVFVLCGALTLAEVAGAIPRTGGVYVFIRESWGRLPAFLFGWSELVIIRAAALGAIATTFSEYLVRVLGHDPRAQPYAQYVHYIAAVAIVLTATFNYVGIKWGALVQNVTTLAKTGALILITILALAIGLPQTGGHFSPALPPGSFSFGQFGLALVSVLWVYDGWADVSFVGGEVRDPERNLPRVLIFGTLIIIALYLLANLAYLAVLPVEQIRQSKLVAADVADRLIGAAGVAFVSVAVMISAFGTLNGSVMTGSRILFTMAADGLLFRPVAVVDRRFQTPSVAIGLPRRHFRHRHRPILRPGGGRDLRTSPSPGLPATVPGSGLSSGSSDLYRCDDPPARQRDRRSRQSRRHADSPGSDPPRNSDFFPDQDPSSGRRQLGNGERHGCCRVVTEFSCRT